MKRRDYLSQRVRLAGPRATSQEQIFSAHCKVICLLLAGVEKVQRVLNCVWRRIMLIPPRLLLPLFFLLPLLLGERHISIDAGR